MKEQDRFLGDITHQFNLHSHNDVHIYMRRMKVSVEEKMGGIIVLRKS